MNLDRMGTFLILKVMRKDLERVSFRLENGANPNLGSYAHIWSALALAAQYGASIEIVDLSSKNGAQVDGSDALPTVAGNGRTDLIKFLLDWTAQDSKPLTFNIHTPLTESLDLSCHPKTSIP